MDLLENRLFRKAEHSLKKSLTVVLGNRPQFIKHAPLDPLLRKQFAVRLIHTGQHYDFLMSDIFFEEFKLPAPDLNLGVGSGTHAFQTARMLEGIESELIANRPHMLLCYGDTNSTLAATLAAVKLSIPVCHVESGPRLYNDFASPEEINRVTADHLSKLKLAPTSLAASNLKKEGITKGIHVVGDTMLDIFLAARKRLAERVRGELVPDLLLKHGLKKNEYVYVTLHRPENVDDPAILKKILVAFARSKKRLVYPIHPRTRVSIKKHGMEDLLRTARNVLLLDPVGYFDSVALLAGCERVLTDSGGLQKEAYFAGKPCVTMMEISPWPETVKAGWNFVAGSNAEKSRQAVRHDDGDIALARDCQSRLELRGRLER
jgi:UDP-GlcNAc3NAcA epimerase